MPRTVKQPAEATIYEFDFTQRLGDQVDGMPVISAAPSGLTIGDPVVQGALVRVRIAGGAPGTSYVVTASASAPGNLASAEIDLDLAVVDLGATLPAGITGPYLGGSEYVTRFGLDETTQLTDGDNTGTIDGAVLIAALSDATDTVNGYLGQLYAIPLAPIPGMVKRIVADLARERLHNDRTTEQVIARADEARSLLRDIAKGLVSLPGVAVPPIGDVSSGGVAYRAPDPVFAGCGLPGGGYGLPAWRSGL